jgi:hypothetical protein
MKKALAAAILVALSALACGGPTDPSKNTVESFTGTVNPTETKIHQFNVANTGEISVTLTAFTPGNAFIGVGYGQFGGGSCALVQSNTATNTNVGRTVLSGQILVKGSYCLAVFDLTNIAPLTVPENYTFEVSHP